MSKQNAAATGARISSKAVSNKWSGITGEQKSAAEMAR
jgi:hypothetical protein